MHRSIPHSSISQHRCNNTAIFRGLAIPLSRQCRWKKPSNAVSTQVRTVRDSEQMVEEKDLSDVGLGSVHSSVDDKDIAAANVSNSSLPTVTDENKNQEPSPLPFVIGVAAGIILLSACGYVFRDDIRRFLEFFIDAVENWGTWGYVSYILVYFALELIAVPAIPLTMTAGVIFGPALGTAVVSIGATAAATGAFLIARYGIRDKLIGWASKNKNFAAIDKAIGKDSFKFVILLRLSPLLPFAASNYLYGLTSVDLVPYVLGSYLGMLPGTFAYVTAGYVGKSVFLDGQGSVHVESWQIILGLGATLLAIGYLGRLAKDATKEVDDLDEKDKS